MNVINGELGTDLGFLNIMYHFLLLLSVLQGHKLKEPQSLKSRNRFDTHHCLVYDMPKIP
jgi:hypothetical protein